MTMGVMETVMLALEEQPLYSNREAILIIDHPLNASAQTNVPNAIARCTYSLSI